MKIEIHKKDYYRILLTDTLPYELPILCSNEGIYNILEKKIVLPKEFEHILNVPQTTIPFSYKIQKDALNSRTLSIPHIKNQIKTCEFYEKYEHIILHLCSRSNISLRYPNKIGNYFYEKNFLKNRVNLKDGQVNVINNGFDEQNLTSSSHFAYKKYNFLYKFYDSYEFHRLERKFSTLMKLDISKFFSHIYTHSISWAVKSKAYAKKNRDATHFEGILDKLFQESNHGETNGILIGPEFSRIFSEIILQKIDCDIIDKIEKTFGHKSENDFSIRRYVDDYFIFSNNHEILKEIETILSSELENYKLYLNESKRLILQRPFITGSTMAKSEIKTAVSEIYASLVDNEKIKNLDKVFKNKTPPITLLNDNNVLFPLKKVWNKKFEADKFIKKIKSIIKRNDITFEQVSSYLLSALKDKFFYAIRKLSLFIIKDCKDDIHRFFSILFEVVFFIYSMDCRVRQTYIISQIALEIVSFTKNQDAESKEVIKKNLFDEIVLCVKSLGPIKNKQVEFSNLLICLNSLGEEYRLSPNNIISILNKDSSDGLKIDYFCICSLLFYIKNDPSFFQLKKDILDRIIHKFSSSPDLVNDCESSLLIVDAMCCPYLDVKEKLSLTKIYFKLAQLKNIQISHSNDHWNTILSNFDKIKFFFDWKGEENLEEILYKKELRSPYE